MRRVALSLVVVGIHIQTGTAIAQPAVQPAPPAQSPSPSEAPAPAAPAPGIPVVIGYAPDSGFAIRSQDDAYKLRVGFQSGYKAEVIFQSGQKATVSDPFFVLRPLIAGNIYRKWIRFWTSLELVGNPPYLLDSYIEIEPIDEFGLRLGQQFTPWSRHEYYGPQQLLFPDWDVVANYFWTGRDKGATAYGRLFDKKIDYWLGAYLGDPLRQFNTIRGNYLFVTRIAVNPAGPPGDTEYAYAEKDEPAPFRYSIAIEGSLAKSQAAQENFNPSTFTFDTFPLDMTTVSQGLGFDAFLQSRRVVGLVEGYYRRTDPRNGQPTYTSLGLWGQVGVLLYERVIDLAVRVSWANANIEASHGQGIGCEVGSTWYIHPPMLAVKLRYGYGDQKGPSDGSSTVGGASLPLPVGTIHVATAQFNLAF